MIQLSRVFIVDIRSNMLLASLFVCKRQEAVRQSRMRRLQATRWYASPSLKNPSNCVLKRVSQD